MMHSQKKLRSYKVIFTGLDNAGKTSFLIALRKKYNFYEEVEDLKPTIKIEYSTFNFLNRCKIYLWDFGGQEKYRRIYLDRTIYFNETKFFYYLIDIQDEKRFTESIDYLQELIQIYKELDFNEEFVVCLNKFDPNLRDNKEIQNRIEILKNIISQIKDTKFKFFATSY
jgi:GTPase SAR1 family protein